jgi:hypothetical protein
MAFSPILFLEANNYFCDANKMGDNPTGEQPEKLFALQGNGVASSLPF